MMNQLMKLRRKLVVLLFSLAVLCLLLCGAASAENKTGVWGNLSWTLTDAGELTISGQGDMKDIGYQPGRGCDPSAWREFKNNIRKVTIEEGVTSVGTYAFYACSNIAQITLPKGLTTIRSNAFWSCDRLKSITLPDTMTEIGGSAFVGSGFESMTIPASVRRIGSSAFENSPLKEISIEPGVTEIGEYAFKNCEHLTAIVLPDTVTELGRYAFYDCYSLASVTLSSNLQTINKEIFSSCKALKSVMIPDGVKTICRDAFEWSYLETIYLPEHVTTVEEDAFNGSKATLYTKFGSETAKALGKAGYSFKDGEIEYKYLFKDGTLTEVYLVRADDSVQTVHVPDGVTVIDFAGFFLCGELKEVSIPEGLQRIADRAFYGCEQLPEITLPGSVVYIGEQAFEKCEGLKKIYFNGTKDQFEAIEKKDKWYSGSAEILWRSLITVSVSGKGTASASVSSGIKGTKVTLTAKPASGYWLSEWKVVSGDVTVKDNAFILGSENVEIRAVFEKTANTATVSGGQYKLNHKKKTAVFTGAEKKTAKSLTIVDTVQANGITYQVTEVAGNACKGLKKLTSLTIGQNVAKIGSKAFYDCGKLKNITILTKKLASGNVGKSAFEKTGKKPVVKCPKAKLKAYKKLLIQRGLDSDAEFKAK